jgi:hypothetical protein
MCPGRWFAETAILLMTRITLLEYEFDPERRLTDEEKYTYSAGNVMRVPVRMTVKLRDKY